VNINYAKKRCEKNEEGRGRVGRGGEEGAKEVWELAFA
jgi:hypothetical protein